MLHHEYAEEVIETALAALSGCLNAAISMSVLARGINLEGEDGEPVDMFGDLQVEFEVAGDLDEEDLRFIEESAGRSAVSNLVTLAHRCEPPARLQNPSVRVN